MVGLTKILAGLAKGLETAQVLLPAAEEMGLPDIVGKVVGVVSAVTNVVNNVKQRIDEGRIVATSEDTDEINRIIYELAKVNDKLAEIIDKS